MRNKRWIFIKKTAHTIAFHIIFALALFVILNSDIEAFSFPTGQHFTNILESNHPISPNVGGGLIFNRQEIVTDGRNQFIKFVSFISINTKPISGKITNESSCKPEQTDFYRYHDSPFFFFTVGCGCFIIGFLIARIRTWLLYS